MKGLKVVCLLSAAMFLALGFGCGKSGEKSKASKDELVFSSLQECQDKFNSIDTYHDYLLTFNELWESIKPPEKAESLLKAKDANKDGVLSKEEFCAGLAEEKKKG